MSFLKIAAMKEETFKLRFVDSHKEAVPALSDIYAAACSGHCNTAQNADVGRGKMLPLETHNGSHIRPLRRRQVGS
ncbi:hypothetical protein EJB05_45622, partial [Eragrostis curvula]